jgi:hypothetical protein
VQSEYNHCLNFKPLCKAQASLATTVNSLETLLAAHTKTRLVPFVLSKQKVQAHIGFREHIGDGKLVESGARAAKSLSENNSGRTGGRDAQQKTNHCSVNSENCWLGECK